MSRTEVGFASVSLADQVNGRKDSYKLDWCYGQEQTTGDIFSREIKPLLEGILKGGNGCVIAYGAQGSGKTQLVQLWVYLRSYALEQMVQAASSTAGLRTIKRVDQTLQDLGEVHLKPKVPTKSVCAEHLELCKEILTVLIFQKQVQNRDAEAANRDSSYIEASSTPKKNASPGGMWHIDFYFIFSKRQRSDLQVPERCHAPALRIVSASDCRALQYGVT